MTSAGSCWFHCLISIQPSSEFTPTLLRSPVPEETPSTGFLCPSSIHSHTHTGGSYKQYNIIEDNTNSKKVPYQLPNPPLWRRGWLVWRPPLGSRPLVPVGGCHPCWAHPCPVSIPSGQLPGLGRRRCLGVHTPGQGWTSACPDSSASECPQPQKGLFPWPGTEWDGAATSGPGAQILNQVLLQVKKNVFSTRQHLVFHRICAFFCTQTFYFTLIFSYTSSNTVLTSVSSRMDCNAIIGIYWENPQDINVKKWHYSEEQKNYYLGNQQGATGSKCHDLIREHS